jgi:hypothetical protein
MKKGTKVPYKPRKYNITKEDLVKWYIEEQLTCKAIGLLYGCSWSTIHQALTRLNIKLRKPIPGKELASKYGHQTRFTNGHENTHIRGDKLVTTEGYVYIYCPEHPFAQKSGHVCEHRLVMEEYLKRYLTKDEVVHHLNEIKGDNRLENLYLCKDRAEHNKFHSLNLERINNAE